jgi:hypothetical protein
MLDVSDFYLILAIGFFKEPLKSVLSIQETLCSQVLAFKKEKIEGKEDQILGIPFRQGRLESREIRGATMIQGDDLSVDQAIR